MCPGSVPGLFIFLEVNMLRKLFVIAAGTLGIVGPGCQTKFPEPPAVAPVRGTVHYREGQPVRGCEIVFVPADSKGAEASAILQSDGTFELKTFGERAGAIPARYRVYFNISRANDQIPARETAESKNRIPARYRSADTSDLILR